MLATLLKEGTATRAADGSGGVVPDVSVPLFAAQVGEWSLTEFLWPNLSFGGPE